VNDLEEAVIRMLELESMNLHMKLEECCKKAGVELAIF
jgi:hypothetical protein